MCRIIFIQGCIKFPSPPPRGGNRIKLLKIKWGRREGEEGRGKRREGGKGRMEGKRKGRGSNEGSKKFPGGGPPL